MSVRRAGHGVFPRNLLNMPDGKSFTGRTQRRAVYNSIVEQDSQNYRQRAFHLTSIVEDKRYTRYFWPTRPDFLPAKQIDRKKERPERAPRRAGKVHSMRKRAYMYLPTQDMKIEIPSSYDVPKSHRDLCLALHSEQNWEIVRSLFQEHAMQVKEGGTVPFDSKTFDACFWTIASAEEDDSKQLEILYMTLKEMRQYAIRNTSYDLTRLQLHRLTRVWTLLWEKHDLTSGEFTHIEFLQILSVYVPHFHGEAASNVFRYLLLNCDTTSKLKMIMGFYQACKSGYKTVGRHQMRLETWSSGSKTAVNDSHLYFPKDNERKLKTWIMPSIIEISRNLEASAEVLDAVVEAIDDELLDNIQPESVIRCLSLFDKTTLINLLPAEIQQMSFQIDKNDDYEDFEIESDTGSSNCPLSKQKIEAISRSCSLRLAHALSATLAHRNFGSDYRFAHCLYRLSSVKNKDGPGNLEVCAYAAAIVAILHRAQQKKARRPSFFRQLQRAVSIFASIRWNVLDPGGQGAADIIRAFRKLFTALRDDSKASSDKRQKCIELLQQFTTALLANDSELNTPKSDDYKSFSSRKKIFHSLLDILIEQNEYAFAKRVYITASQFKKQDLASEPLLRPSPFLWLFQASLSSESDINFSELLFTHWDSIQNRPSAAPWLPHLPSSLVRMYSDKLLANGKVHRMSNLEKHLELDQNSSFALDTKNKSRITSRQNAIRTSRVAFGAGQEHVEEALKIANIVIQRWQEERKIGHEDNDTLVLLYSIALDKSTVWLNQSTSFLRAKILSVFKNFREYFGLLDDLQDHKIFKRRLKSEMQINLHVIYRCALMVLIRQKRGKELQEEVETIVNELSTKWKQPIGADIYGIWVEAYTVGKEQVRNLDRAIEIFEKGIDEAEKVKEILPATPTAKLIKANTDILDFFRAEKVFQMYKAHTLGLSKSSIIMVEAAGIDLAYQQGRRLEASWRVDDLIKEVQEVDCIPTNINWLRNLRKVSRTFKAQDMEGRIEQEASWSSSSSTKPSTEITTEEDNERVKAFGAMASGQPFKWKWLRTKLFPSTPSKS